MPPYSTGQAGTDQPLRGDDAVPAEEVFLAELDPGILFRPQFGGITRGKKRSYFVPEGHFVSRELKLHRHLESPRRGR